MDLHLTNKRAAVMAASEGLGRAAAHALSREGARVAICARTKDSLEETAKEIEADTGNEVVAFPTDVSNEGEVRAFVDGAADAFGGLDVLVTNKGGPPHGTFDDVDDAGWQAGFELVVLSYVRAVRAALPHFEVAGAGAVVAIESTSVKQPIANLVLSNALRPAVVATSKSLAHQYGPKGVRFNVVLPGSMETERLTDLVRDEAERDGIAVDEAMARRVGDVPLRRLGQPAELADLIAYLASPAAAYVTGGVFQLDGGAITSVY